MGTTFIGHGGCGSAAMILRLWESGHACHGRPDVAFFPSDTPELTKSAREGMQVLSARGLEDHPTPEAAALFAERADGYRLDTRASIFDNMAAYLDHVAAQDAHTWLCRAPMFGLLTHCRDHRAVCLLRHPLHQYLSFTQHYRHADWTLPFGGRFSPDAVRYFARAWIAFAADCLEQFISLVDCSSKTSSKAIPFSNSYNSVAIILDFSNNSSSLLTSSCNFSTCRKVFTLNSCLFLIRKIFFLKGR